MKKIILLIIITFFTTIAFSQQQVSLDNPLARIGDSVVVNGRIYGGAYLKNVSTKPTFLNLGDTSPRHRVIIRIEPEDRDKFSAPPEVLFLNKEVRVAGILKEYKGGALIRISNPEMIKIQGDQQTEVKSPKPEPLPQKAVVQKIVEQPNAKIEQPKHTDTLFQVAPVRVGFDGKERNIRKKIVLRASPQNRAPVVAILDPGTVIVIPSLTKKWSYVFVKTDNGSSRIFGFIKTKYLKRLKIKK